MKIYRHKKLFVQFEPETLEFRFSVQGASPTASELLGIMHVILHEATGHGVEEYFPAELRRIKEELRNKEEEIHKEAQEEYNNARLQPCVEERERAYKAAVTECNQRIEWSRSDARKAAFRAVDGISTTQGMSGRTDFWLEPEVFAVFGEKVKGPHRHVLHVSMTNKLNMLYESDCFSLTRDGIPWHRFTALVLAAWDACVPYGMPVHPVQYAE